MEETIFRGYLLKQFSAWTGNATFAVILQATIFGISHSYFGIRQVLIIASSGMLIGFFTQWRKSLRPAIIFHS